MLSQAAWRRRPDGALLIDTTIDRIFGLVAGAAATERSRVAALEARLGEMADDALHRLRSCSNSPAPQPRSKPSAWRAGKAALHPLVRASRTGRRPERGWRSSPSASVRSYPVTSRRVSVHGTVLHQASASMRVRSRKTRLKPGDAAASASCGVALGARRYSGFGNAVCGSAARPRRRHPEDIGASRRHRPPAPSSPMLQHSIASADAAEPARRTEPAPMARAASLRLVTREARRACARPARSPGRRHCHGAHRSPRPRPRRPHWR